MGRWVRGGGKAAALVVAFGPAMMASAGETPQLSAVQLRCTVSPLAPHVAPEFAQEFCEALRDNLARDLAVPFELTASAWAGDGKAVEVELKIASASRADVTTAYGDVKGGVFSSRSVANSELSSVDRPLRPAASRALVRGIGIQMGLVR